MEVFYFYLASMGLLGLLVGSFLNVVIARLPQMMQNACQPEDDKHSANSFETPYNLCIPASHCPRCQQKISWFDNIPLLSFLWLKGHCRQCHQTISWRYPFVEALTAVLSIWVTLQFGLQMQTAAALILIWILIAISFIDIDHQLIPDDLTLSGIWLGLLVSIFEIFQTPTSAILGAIGGYLILWSVYWVFKWVTGKEGMGYGDFKLLAMLGAWFGWQALPWIVFISSFLGAMVGISLMVVQKRGKNIPMPFGPFLALGGLVVLFWGSYLNHLYFNIL